MRLTWQPPVLGPNEPRARAARCRATDTAATAATASTRRLGWAARHRCRACRPPWGPNPRGPRGWSRLDRSWDLLEQRWCGWQGISFIYKLYLYWVRLKTCLDVGMCRGLTNQPYDVGMAGNRSSNTWVPQLLIMRQMSSVFSWSEFDPRTTPTDGFPLYKIMICIWRTGRKECLSKSRGVLAI